VVHAWQEKYPATARRVRVEFSEQPGLDLVELLNGMDAAILVDALYNPAEPIGTIHNLGLHQLESFGISSRSAHGWGVAEGLNLARQLNPAIEDIQVEIIGISIGLLENSTEMRQDVKQSIPAACDLIEEKVRVFLEKK
jgi:hydrogenase maturation protease